MIKRYLLLLIFVAGTGIIKGADKPVFPDMAGWKKNVIDKIYTSDDLWELINGAADIFLTYYFEDLHMAEYVMKDELIRVELYRHKTTDDTYGIYSAERMPDYPQVNIGTQGYKSQGVLNFFSGNYYVKIMSAGVQESSEQTIADLAGRVEAELGQNSGMPAVLNLFPTEGQIKLSDSYIAQNFMGYSFLHSAFVMKYESPGEFQMFVINRPEEQQKIADKYIELVKKENVSEQNGILILKDPFNGTVYLKQHKGYLIGVSNTENTQTAIEYINKVIEKI